MSGTCCTTLVIHNYLIETYIRISFLRRFMRYRKGIIGIKNAVQEKFPELD